MKVLTQSLISIFENKQCPLNLKSTSHDPRNKSMRFQPKPRNKIKTFPLYSLKLRYLMLRQLIRLHKEYKNINKNSITQRVQFRYKYLQMLDECERERERETVTEWVCNFSCGKRCHFKIPTNIIIPRTNQNIM